MTECHQVSLGQGGMKQMFDLFAMQNHSACNYYQCNEIATFTTKGHCQKGHESLEGD